MVSLRVIYNKHVFVLLVITFITFYTVYLTATIVSGGNRDQIVEKDKTESGSDQGSGENGIIQIGSERTYLDLEKSLCLHSFEHETEVKSKKPCPTKGIVTVYEGGRLGNQIWEYAAMWAVSKETGLEAYAPRCIYNTISKVFKILPHPSMEEISHCPVDLENFSETVGDWKGETQGIILEKWATEPQLVAKWQKYIPIEFPIWDELVKNSEHVLLEAKKKFSGNVFVGIHVRRTDYSDFIKKFYDGRAPDKDFFMKAMEYYEKKYENVIFIVASDDRKWCEENLGSKDKVFIAPQGTQEEDLTLMSMCNHSIFDYGTYGGWGAIYAGGETVYYYIPKYIFPQDVGKVLPGWKSV